MTDPKLCIFAIASIIAFVSGLLVIFRKAHWLGNAVLQQAISRKEEMVVGGVLLFVGVLGILTSYAVLIMDDPMYFVGLVFGLFA